MSHVVRRRLALISVAAAAAALTACIGPGAPPAPPAHGDANAEPASVVEGGDASLVGSWDCWVVEPGVGFNSVNVGGIGGGSGWLGSFELVDGSSYAGLNGSGTPGSYRFDAASGSFTFLDGGLYGLEGRYGAGPDADRLLFEGVGNGWDDPNPIHLLCEAA